MVGVAGIVKAPGYRLSPDGFKNHTLVEEGGSSSPEPKIFIMFCADAEIPVLCK